MPPDPATRWARIDALFAGALELPPERIHEWLEAETGGDEGLRREVQSLLDSLTRAGEVIGESADALVSLSGPLVEPEDPVLPPGTLLGGYVVRRELGRGGMGAVYLAERADGDFEREVAIKVVGRGTDPDSLIRRFLAERRILATLEHPNIARLYDSGVTSDGRPFLVMEAVAGERLDRHADQRQLDIAARLALFDAVCEAVAFAHQRLVVHRDLKPANVLVSSEGRVALLDFGIARLIAGDDVEGTTRPGQLVLTPEYAAPEQFRGETPGMSVDVYALGVMLHELLTGSRPPWQRLVMTRADAATVEVALVAPSAGIAQAARTGGESAERVRTAAAARGCSTDALRRRLAGDLDVIVLTALAPDPQRRYPSVQALRDDLRRHRDGFPIVARPPSAAYRARKFARRNPVLVAAAAMALTLVSAFVVSTRVQAGRVAAERDVASAERDRANVERDRARQVSGLLVDLFARSDPFAPGRADTLRVSQFLALGAERVQRDLAGQPAVRAELLAVLGRAYRGLGDFAEAQRLLDEAVALRRGDPATTPEELAATLGELGHLARLRERHVAAESLHLAALALRSAQPDSGAKASPEATGARAASLANAAVGLLERGRFDSARVYFDSALRLVRSIVPADTTRLAEILNNRATLAMRTGDFPTAESMAREALALNTARLGRDHPRVAAEVGNLGFLLDRLGRTAEAEPLLRESLGVLRARLPAGHPNIRSVMLNLGGALGRLGRLEEGERLVAEVVALERAQGGDARLQLAMALDNQAGLLERLQRRDDAERTYREALQVQLEATGEDHPGTAILRGKVADAACRSGTDHAGAVAEFERALAVLDRVFPPNHGFRLGARGQYGNCLVRAGRREEGELALTGAFDGARRSGPATAPMARLFGGSLLELYRAAGDSGRVELLRAQLDSLGAAAR